MKSVAGVSLADQADAIDDHFHNEENVFGLAAAPTGAHGGDLDRLTPYHLISGNNAFGTPVLILGTSDTPVRAGRLLFDLRRFTVVAVSNANPFLFRIIWGTPAQTSAQALAALQYTTTMIHQLAANGNNTAQDLFNVRVPVWYQQWASIKSATNLANIDVYVLMHEYPSDTP